MAGKSRRKRAKQAQRRKIEVRQRSTTAARMPIAPRSGESVAHPEAPFPPVVTSRQPVTAQAIRHPYITAELRAIGILTGIMAIIFIILYFTLT